MTTEVTITAKFRVYAETPDGLASTVQHLKSNVHEELWADADVHDLNVTVEVEKDDV